MSLDDFYVMMTSRTLHLFQNMGQGATQSCERLRQFARRELPTVPHISLERGTRGYPEPYLETRDQSGVYRLRKIHIMKIMSTLSPTWSEQRNRGLISGPACTTLEHLTQTYLPWDPDQWKINLPLMETYRRTKGWIPTTELVVGPHERWVERVNSPAVMQFYK